MPANLTPEYKEAEERYRQAVTPAEKLAALEEMLAVIPKHKGTEKLQADIKRRISKLKDRDGQKTAHGRRQALYMVEKEGGGQVVLVGPPNSGKSKLLSRLTNAQPDIGEYPFTTQLPLPGMMQYEDIKIQIVDIPAISQFTEPWVAAIARNSDALLFVIDASSEAVLEEIESSIKVLEGFRVGLQGWGCTPPGGESELLTLKKTLLVANKMDRPESVENLDIIRTMYGDRFPIFPVSSESGEGLEELRREIFVMLEIVRVYTKIPGKPPDMGAPYVLPKGSTVLGLANMIHKDLGERLRFARIWAAKKFDGQMVSREHILEDRDVIELHA